MTPTGPGLERDLAALRIPPSASLLDRVVSQWLRVDEGPAPVFVTFTERGIDFVRTTASVGGRAEVFLEAYRRRFDRPARPATRTPPGLVGALRTGRSSTLRFDLGGLTPFERDVLTAALGIPPGETRPYHWVAREVGRPAAVRAVGTALGHNPVPILIPCHRVTRADGSPGGYAFGTEAKDALLRAEDVDVDAVAAMARRRVFYVGSVTTRIVCFPTCRHARRIADRNRTGFRSAAEAVAAGYRPCRHCRPEATAVGG